MRSSRHKQSKASASDDEDSGHITKADLNSLWARMEGSIKTQLKEVIHEVREIKEELSRKLELLEERVTRLEPVHQRVVDLEDELQQLRAHMDGIQATMEAEQIAGQLVITGLPEEPNEGSKEYDVRSLATEGVALNFLKQTMEVEGHITVDDAFRAGSKPGNRPRPLILKMPSRKEASAILKKKANKPVLSRLRTQNIQVQPCLTKSERARRAAIQDSPAFNAAAKAAKDAGQVISWRRDVPFIAGTEWKVPSQVAVGDPAGDPVGDPVGPEHSDAGEAGGPWQVAGSGGRGGARGRGSGGRGGKGSSSGH